MSLIIKSESADGVWREAISSILESKRASQESRCGDSIELLNVLLEIQNPMNRWVLSRHPAINVPFAIAEVVWILSGRNDSRFLNYFNGRLPEFAGNGSEYHGAYGNRIRFSNGLDQLKRAYQALKTNPETRQIVLQIWNSGRDFPDENGKPTSEDIPCNICAMLKVRNGKLHWTQIMRSNDGFRGLPYNIVQFTTLHEIFAGWLGLEIGSYFHYADSLHIYEENIGEFEVIQEQLLQITPSERTISSFQETEDTLLQLQKLIETIIDDARSTGELKVAFDFLNVSPYYQNWARILVAEGYRRRRAKSLALGIIEECSNPLLKAACERWFQRFS